MSGFRLAAGGNAIDRKLAVSSLSTVNGMKV